MAFNPEQKYIIEEKQIPIDDFYKYKEDFVTRPPYQRKNVWSKIKQQNLLDSLFRRYYIPKVVIREIRLSPDRTINEVIDGQQRITTVQNFYEGNIKLPKSLSDLNHNLPGKAYEELDTEMRRFVDRYLTFSADVVKSIDDPKNVEHQKIATEIFWRLQQGESLNYMEVAHAKLSSLSRNVIVKYSDDISFDFDNYQPLDSNPDKHNFFNIIDRNNDRMQHLMLMTRFLMLEKANSITELKDTAVVDFIDEYVTDNGIGNYSLENENFVKMTLKNLNLLNDIFSNDIFSENNDKVKELRREYIIISLYLLLKHLKDNYKFQEEEKKLFYDFYLAFHDRWINPDEEDTDILQFQAHRQQSIANIETRHIIMRQLFFKYALDNSSNLILKDSDRIFSEYERIKIYRKDKGLCQMCLDVGKSEKEAFVSWKDYDADHIKPHSLGGETSIENGRVLCRYHNRSRGNSI
jgi:hypothetical protein